MTIFWRNLIMITLFMVPVYGQVTSTPAQTAEGNASGNGAVIESQAASIPPVAEAREPSLGFPLFRTIGGLGLVLCLMIAGYFVAKKFAPRYFVKNAADRNLKVIETLSMGDRRSISMIEVGSSRFLVGNTPHQINLLAALPEPLSLVSEPETLPATPKTTARKESMSPFRNLFEVEKRRSTQYAGSPLPEDIRNKMRQLREALDR